MLTSLQFIAGKSAAVGSGAERHQYKRRRVRVAELGVVPVTVDRPRTVGTLACQQRPNRARKEFLPITPAHLIHGLAAVEQCVVIPVVPARIERDVYIVRVEIVSQNPIGRTDRLGTP